MNDLLAVGLAFISGTALGAAAAFIYYELKR
jgi:hypothetical protein